jgi:flagellar M-ring protein FliF
VDSILQTLRSLGTVRLAAMGGVAVGLVIFFFFLTSRLNTSEMALLYGNLSATDSGKIIGQLESMGIPYEVRADGTQVLVPNDKALGLRMKMAEAGLPNGGSIGYEIFDRSEGLGTTSFVQNVNLLRALEGELSRTIRAINQVREARVHLVMPKRELFSRRKLEPTASVVIRTSGTDRLPKAQVMAIKYLVAAAVPSLKINRISIIDQRGRLLARAGEGDDDGAMISADSEEFRRAKEGRLVRTVEELLERSVGIGKVRAQVNVEMDFDRITTNSETFDPEGQVVRSTQTVEESAKASDASASSVSVANNLPDSEQNNANGGNANASARTEETVNYEISKTVKTYVRESGIIRRLSIAVLVDGTYTTDKDGKSVYAPRSKEQLEQLTALVRSTVGYNAERGDKVELVNLQFIKDDDSDLISVEPLFGLTKSDYFRIGEIFVLAIVGILVILLVVRPLVARTLDALPSALEAAKEHALLADHSEDSMALSGPSGTGMSSAAVEEEDTMIDLDAVEGRVKASTLKKIAEIVERHPEETVGIIRQWMYSET